LQAPLAAPILPHNLNYRDTIDEGSDSKLCSDSYHKNGHKGGEQDGSPDISSELSPEASQDLCRSFNGIEYRRD
jgi:hypothetical protein